MTPSKTHTMIRVAEKVIEHPGESATLYFDAPITFTPGQFVMFWIPGVDEKPYTLSFVSPARFGITIEAKGIFSQKAIALEPGDLVGIRGPFGNGFTLPDEPAHTVFVAGGFGMAPLAPLIDTLLENGENPLAVIHGARTRSHLLYHDSNDPNRNPPERHPGDRQFCTDDGSYGHKGFVTDLLLDLLGKGASVEQVYACGPEIMMHAVVQICRGEQIPCQVSLERYMRCGFGVCGACVCGEQVVCTDGPVFDDTQVSRMADFNRRALLKNGQIVDLDTYFTWRQPR
ncbi:MAG: dihydroorotate dehydrogenase electron transfer subunit [Desulfobacteraceae bacterium]|nr:MAG: dihydroorotate dehydrogenase electron transfer subunit [Desulfobacteraceae bacterium]